MSATTETVRTAAAPVEKVALAAAPKQMGMLAGTPQLEAGNVAATAGMAAV